MTKVRSTSLNATCLSYEIITDFILECIFLFFISWDGPTSVLQVIKNSISQALWCDTNEQNRYPEQCLPVSRIFSKQWNLTIVSGVEFEKLIASEIQEESSRLLNNRFCVLSLVPLTYPPRSPKLTRQRKDFRTRPRVVMYSSRFWIDQNLLFYEWLNSFQNAVGRTAKCTPYEGFIRLLCCAALNRMYISFRDKRALIVWRNFVVSNFRLWWGTFGVVYVGHRS